MAETTTVEKKTSAGDAVVTIIIVGLLGSLFGSWVYFIQSSSISPEEYVSVRDYVLEGTIAPVSVEKVLADDGKVSNWELNDLLAEAYRSRVHQEQQDAIESLRTALSHAERSENESRHEQL